MEEEEGAEEKKERQRGNDRHGKVGGLGDGEEFFLVSLSVRNIMNQ